VLGKGLVVVTSALAWYLPYRSEERGRRFWGDHEHLTGIVRIQAMSRVRNCSRGLVKWIEDFVDVRVLLVARIMARVYCED